MDKTTSKARAFLLDQSTEPSTWATHPANFDRIREAAEEIYQDEEYVSLDMAQIRILRAST